MTDPAGGDGSATRAVEAVWRIEAARVIATLTRAVGDLTLAEDVAQDALVAALEQWPVTGMPRNPGSWLTTVARRRAVDRIRRETLHARSVETLGRELPEAGSGVDDIEVELHVEDDVLRLMFLTCHPAVPRDARIALTLKLVAGLSTEQIARLSLVSPATLAQRIVRAKRTLAEVGAGLEVPVGQELARRFGSVLQVVHAVFTEGYAATSGPTWSRGELCDEAMRLARMLAALAVDEPEAHGLVALEHLHASRLRARVGPGNRAVPLDEQDRSRWDRLLITYGLASLARGEQLVAARGKRRGPFLVQAQIAACHARAVTAAATDWPRIAVLYGELAALTPSPVVELNRAVAVSMSDGPAVALPLVEALAGRPELRTYFLLPATRADLLRRLGRTAEARAEYERAAALTGNAVQREFLLGRAAGC